MIKNITSKLRLTVVQNASCRNARLMVVHLTLCLICSCMKEVPPPVIATDIEQTNQKRQELGIRLIKPTWVLGHAEFGAEDWFLNTNRSSYGKRVQRDSKGQLIWEEDYYHSGKTYHTFDGTGWERVVIHYDYRNGLYFLHYLGTNNVFSKIAEPLCEGSHDRSAIENAASAILNPWGMKQRD